MTLTPWGHLLLAGSTSSEDISLTLPIPASRGRRGRPAVGPRIRRGRADGLRLPLRPHRAVGRDADHLAARRQGQPAPAAHQQPLAQRRFQRLDLRADRGRGEIQDFSGTGHATFAGHGPEIEQMMIVEPVHV